MTHDTQSRELVPDRHRSTVVHDLFGFNYPLQLEPTIFSIASNMSDDYGGGAYWQFYRVGENGEGFFMAPDVHHDYFVRSANGWSGVMGPEAFGLVTCLTAYSWLSFRAASEIGFVYARHFHLVRDYAAHAAQARAIFAAID